MPEEFVIDQEFAERMFQTSAACDEDLESSLLESGGPMDKLHVAEFPADDGSPDIVSVLMDGHRRHAICEKHGLPFTVTRRTFASREDALAEMDAIQLRRRNLNPTQEGIVRARMVAHRISSHPEHHVEDVVEDVAEETGVTGRTVFRDMDTAKSLEKVAPNLRALAVAELTKIDIRRLSELDYDEQRSVVSEFQDGEFTSLKAAINGEKYPDDVVEPKKKGAKPDKQEAAQRALGKLQDAIHDLNVAMPNATNTKVAKSYTDRLANLLSAWGA